MNMVEYLSAYINKRIEITRKQSIRLFLLTTNKNLLFFFFILLRFYIKISLIKEEKNEQENFIDELF